MENNENRLIANFAYCIDTEEIVFENGNKVQLKDLVSDYLFPKEATAKENLAVPMSVIEDIKAEIKENIDDYKNVDTNNRFAVGSLNGLLLAQKIIDRHIGEQA